MHRMTWPFKDRWDRALPYEQFVRESTEHCLLWTGVYAAARIPDWARLDAAPGGRFRLVVIAEDWCGDAANSVPVVAKWAAHAPGVELKVLRRDEHPDVMDRYLTGAARSIPVVIVLDEHWTELGWWGPRPRELQQWVMEQRASGRPKNEIYPDIRRWYARDKGQSTLREVLAIMQGDAAPSS